MTPHSSIGRVTVVTPSYRPDLAITGELCRSIDAHFRLPFQHLLIVPRRDVSRFAKLAGPNRRILVAENLLAPHGFRKLPLPSRLHIPGIVDRRLREQWYKKGAGRISGWLIQQIIKLQSAELTEDELLVFIDSDLVFIRDVTERLFHAGDRLRLHRSPGLASSAHRLWRDTVLELIGLDPAAAEEASFIGNVVTWKRSNLVRLLSRIEEVTGADWRTAVARARTVSEYMLYGYYSAYLLPDRGGHGVEKFDAVHSLWVDDPEQKARFVHGLRPEHVAIHIQSALLSDLEGRRRLVDEVVANADGGKVGR